MENPNQGISTETRGRNKKKRRSDSRWIAEVEQRCYSAKLLEALRCVREKKAPAPSRAFREAADRALAVAARGRSRWSRAILSSRLGQPNIHKKGAVARRRTVWIYRSLEKKLSAVKTRTRILGRLIPGCRKLMLPSLLEEATDYIGALEMQVRAMTALTELLAPSSDRSPPFTF